MKKILNILCASAALLAVISACQEKPGQENTKVVDLRYRALDNYDLAATDAQSFTILRPLVHCQRASGLVHNKPGRG